MASPLANNKLNSLGTFEQRDIYLKKSYPEGVAPKPIDLWHEKQLYGKVDERRDSVFPSEGFLKQIQTDTEETVMVLNFVADAFEDLRAFFRTAASKGKLEQEDTELLTLEPTTGWTSVNRLWTNYMNVLYDVFAETFVNDKDRNEKIVNFDSFFRIFIEYLEVLTPHYPFSRSAFVVSKYCPHQISGLMIEIAEEKHDEDRTKFEKFIQDPNFIFYTKAARQFGFLVDKNAPWRLTADVASPAMTPYMKAHKIDLDNLFVDLYYRSYKLDIEALKVFVRQFYNSFVEASPGATTTLPPNRRRGTTKQRLLREPITEVELERRYSPAFWLKFYIFLRAREIDRNFNQQQFDKLVRESQELNRLLDNERAIDYANSRLRGVVSPILDVNQVTSSDIRERVKLTPRPRKDFSFF